MNGAYAFLGKSSRIAADIAFTPVLMLGSGRGAYAGLWIPGGEVSAAVFPAAVKFSAVPSRK